MKSSKLIHLSIIATSIASCHSPNHNRPVVTSSGDWNDTTSGDYYINDGYGYSRSYYFHPFYVGYNPYYIMDMFHVEFLLYITPQKAIAPQVVTCSDDAAHMENWT